jgi:hypothetical protein
MKSFSKMFSVLALCLLLVTGFKVAVAPVMAIDLGINYATNVGLSGTGDEDIRDTAVKIIRYLMTFLAIIAVSIILYGGFMWMTAAGNDDRVSKAKAIIKAGVIGLIIILAAFAIVLFVIDITQNAINGI